MTVDAPWDALREMLRVAKPGGVVAAREADLTSQCIWPDLPAISRFHEVHEKVTKAAGMSWTGGRQLVSWALKAGATRDQITASYGTWCFSAPEDRKMWGMYCSQFLSFLLSCIYTVILFLSCSVLKSFFSFI